MPAKLNRDIRLPFRTRTVELFGRTVEEYSIPEVMKGPVLDLLYPFRPVPRLGDVRYDLHAGRLFVVREFRVFRDMEMNFLASPYSASGGGLVIDWAPADWAPDEYDSSRLKGDGPGDGEGQGGSRLDGVREAAALCYGGPPHGAAKPQGSRGA